MCSPFTFLAGFVVFIALTILEVCFNVFIFAVEVHKSIKRAKAFIAFAATF
jgi:hypothetical protein